MKSVFKSLLLLLVVNVSFAQNLPNDCTNYIQVCDDQSVTYNVSGAGVQEIIPMSCSSQEHNSLWMRVTIDQPGTLGFVITPQSTSIAEDYDFWVFGPSSTCSNLGSPIRCSTTNPQAAGQSNNHTGLNSSSSDTTEGPGADGDSFLAQLNVLAGQNYFIVIDRPIGNSAFSLQWTGTATILNPFQNVSLGQFSSISLCDEGNDGLEVYDFDTLTAGYLNGVSGFTVSYFGSDSDATFNANAFSGATTIAQGTYYARVDSDTSDCFEIKEINVVFEGVVAQDYPITLCEELGVNYASVDLSTFESNVYSGNQNVTYSYYSTENDATAMQSALTNWQNLQLAVGTYSYYVRVDMDASCFDVAEITINVVERPVVNADVELRQCDDDTDGFTSFNLNEANSLIVSDVTGLMFQYYYTLAEATNGINAIVDANHFENQTVGSQTIYYSVTNTNQCRTIGELQLLVGTTQVPDTFQTLQFYSCDVSYGAEEDGIAVFDFSDATVEFTNLFPTQTIQVAYYETLEDALAESNAIVDASSFVNTEADTQTIYVRLDSEVNNECVGLGEYVQLNVVPRPITTETDSFFICTDANNNQIQVNAGIRNGFSTSNYSYQWYFNGQEIAGENSYTTTVNEAGSYEVEVTDNYGCVYTREVEVDGSEAAQIEDVIISDLTDNKQITVVVSGSGDYEYSLDGENYQESPVFTIASYGIFTVYVNDINGCGIVTREIIVLGFPKFFTPNGDGINDFWNVFGINERYSTHSKISIFDRYGKLIKQFRSTTTGWDGTFNGNPLPATDYWCVVELPDGRTYKGHFSLIR